MAHAERCPLCSGEGKIIKYNEGMQTTSKTCHGCNGKGWVEVHDSSDIYPPRKEKKCQ